MSWLSSIFGGGLSPELTERVCNCVADGAKVVDVRTPMEFSMGHVDGAINISLDQLSNKLKTLGSPKKPVVLYCASGSRSRVAATLLRQAGFEEVLDVGPMHCWPVK